MKMRTSKATSQRVRTSSKMCTSMLLVAVVVVVESWMSEVGKSVGRYLHKHMRLDYTTRTGGGGGSAFSWLHMSEGRGCIKEIHCK